MNQLDLCKVFVLKNCKKRGPELAVSGFQDFIETWVIVSLFLLNT